MSEMSLEYTALRNEILKRIEMRQQLISMTLAIAGVFLGVGVTTGVVPLIYPPLAAFLALGWVQNDLRIAQIGRYIRERLEPTVPDLAWETYSQERREHDPWRWRFTVVSHIGVFVVTQLMAIGIGWARFTATPLEWSLLGLDIAAVVVVLLIMTLTRRVPRRRDSDAEKSGSGDAEEHSP
jgi:hypothetical protein